MQTLLQEHNDAAELIRSELSELIALNKMIAAQLDLFIVGNPKVVHKSTMNLEDSSFVDVHTNSKILHNFEETTASGLELSYYRPQSPKSEKQEDEGFDSHEFLDEDTVEKSPTEDTAGRSLEASITGNMRGLSLKEPEEPPAEEFKELQSFLESLSPNQEAPNESLNSIVQPLSPPRLESQTDSRKLSEEASKIEKLQFDKLNEAQHIDPETKESLRDLMEKSSDLINSGLEINKHLTTIEEEESVDSRSKESIVLSKNIYSYSEWAKAQSNKLIGDLNGVVESFS